MNIKLQKTATACGLFATGLIAGYTASKFSVPAKKHVTSLRDSATFLSEIKIIPTIPDFDTETSISEFELDLAMDE